MPQDVGGQKMRGADEGTRVAPLKDPKTNLGGSETSSEPQLGVGEPGEGVQDYPGLSAGNGTAAGKKSLTTTRGGDRPCIAVLPCKQWKSLEVSACNPCLEKPICCVV